MSLSRRNICAHTSDADLYPEFISINREPDFSVTVTIREPAFVHLTDVARTGLKKQGAQAMITLPAAVWIGLRTAIMAERATDAEIAERESMLLTTDQRIDLLIDAAAFTFHNKNDGLGQRVLALQKDQAERRAIGALTALG